MFCARPAAWPAERATDGRRLKLTTAAGAGARHGSPLHGLHPSPAFSIRFDLGIRGERLPDGRVDATALEVRFHLRGHPRVAPLQVLDEDLQRCHRLDPFVVDLGLLFGRERQGHGFIRLLGSLFGLRLFGLGCLLPVFGNERASRGVSRVIARFCRAVFLWRANCARFLSFFRLYFRFYYGFDYLR
jgi:hypothetical protein